MKIDAHHHIWDLSVRDQDWIVGEAMKPIRRNFSMQDLRVAVADTGIEKTVLVQTVTTYAETPEFLALADSDSMIAGVVGWLDIDSLTAHDHLGSYLDLPGAEYLVGIRDIAQGHADPDYLARPNVIKNVKTLGEKGLTYDLLTKTRELPAAIELVKNAPDVQFILDHISKPFIETGEMEPWRELIVKLASLPNVVCKISGMVTEANWSNWKTDDFRPYVDLLLEVFGAKRLLFGSDWPVCTLAGSYGQVIDLAEALTSSFSTSEKEDFWSATAIRTYGLTI
ncbi:MAG: amidohydrolase family protein [Actinomycetota bacterium]